MTFSLCLKTLRDTAFYTIYAHSLEDETAAAFAEFVLSEHILFNMSQGPFIATQLNSTSSGVELRRRRYRHFADATQLNSTSSGDELSCVVSL